MDPLVSVLAFLHVAGGAAWLGSSLFANAFLVPFVVRQPAERQRDLVAGLLQGPERLIIGGALLTALTGPALGVALGRIRSLDSIATSYGLAWSAAIAVAVLVFATGGRVTSPAMRRLVADGPLWQDAAGSLDERERAWRRLRLGFRIELGGILVILALMVVLRAV